MIATQRPTEDLVWISEAGRRDSASTRLNQKRVRQQAKRFHVNSKERQRLSTPSTFQFVNGFPTPHSSRASTISTSAVTDAEENAQDEGRMPQIKAKRWVVKADSPAKKRLLRLQNVALKLQRISEGGYSAAKIEYNFDIVDLSTFTSAHMGRAAATALYHNKSARSGYLRAREASFLDHVPRLYVASPLLRMVVDCVLAQAQRTLCNNSRITQAEIFTLYDKALRGVQDALSHEVTAVETDVLCSVQLMQLFEALNSDYLAFWSQHSAGIRRLIRMRGPERCDTDFERALFCSQLGTMFGEALIDRSDCFLGEPQWQAAFCRFIRTEKSLHKRLELKLWSLEVLVPGFMREADEIIYGHREGSTNDLFMRMRRHKLESLRLEEEASCETDNSEKVCYRMLENLALAYGADILVNRTMISLEPLSPGSGILEDETMDLANKIFATGSHLQLHAPRADLLIARATQVARMAESTHTLVQAATEGRLDVLRNGRITPEIWETQSRGVGRKELVGGFSSLYDTTSTPL